MPAALPPASVVAEPLGPASGPGVWDRDWISGRADWLDRLHGAELDELVSEAARLDKSSADLMHLERRDFSLPKLGPKLEAIRQRIIGDIGFVQIRGLPIHRMGRRRAAIAFWIVARHLGDAVVSQNAKGHLLGHVKDLGQTLADPSSRGPYTRERIEYHSDACDVVGLLCLHPARSGGESTLVSAGQVYNVMLERRPDLVEALCAEEEGRGRRGAFMERKP